MANFKSVTSSNNPYVKDLNAVQKAIKRYPIISDVTFGVNNGYLYCYGYDWPACTVENDPELEASMSCDDLFDLLLKEIAPYLASNFIIHMIGHEKCNFPLSAIKLIVKPDGTISYTHLFATEEEGAVIG